MLTESERILLHKGAKFDLERVTVLARSGKPVQREVIRHPGAVCVLPILDPESPGAEHRVVAISNVRPALGRSLIELCAGTLEPGEDPALCAGRELIEETGYQAEQITPIGTFYTTPGMTDELMHAFVATGLTHVGQDLEADEDIEVLTLTLSRTLELIDSGEFADAKSILTVLLALRQNLIAPQSPTR